MAGEGKGVQGAGDGDFPAAILPYRDVRIFTADEMIPELMSVGVCILCSI